MLPPIAPGTCPKGHVSTATDYCSECGARLTGDAPVDVAEASANAPASTCPDCGGPHGAAGVVFCEICGFRFADRSQTHDSAFAPAGADSEAASISPSLPAVPAEEPPAQEPAGEAATEPAAEPATEPAGWYVVISVDPSLNDRDATPAPEPGEPTTLPLHGERHLIGRQDETRGIYPEIAIQKDEAVSRRHALLERTEGGKLLLRDVGSANGTRLNGTALDPMVSHELAHGDEITLGHWTRIRVEGR